MNSRLIMGMLVSFNAMASAQIDLAIGPAQGRDCQYEREQVNFYLSKDLGIEKLLKRSQEIMTSLNQDQIKALDVANNTPVAPLSYWDKSVPVESLGFGKVGREILAAKNGTIDGMAFGPQAVIREGGNIEDTRVARYVGLDTAGQTPEGNSIVNSYHFIQFKAPNITNAILVPDPNILDINKTGKFNGIRNLVVTREYNYQTKIPRIVVGFNYVDQGVEKQAAISMENFLNIFVSPACRQYSEGQKFTWELPGYKVVPVIQAPVYRQQPVLRVPVFNSAQGAVGV